MTSFLSRRALVGGLTAGAGLVVAGADALAGVPVVAPKVFNKSVNTSGLPKLPGADLRPLINKRGLVPRSQRTDCCTIFASAFLIEYMQPFLTRSATMPPYASTEYLNWAANEATASAEDGAYFWEVALGYDKWGEVAETAFPAKDEFDATLSPPDDVRKAGKARERLAVDIFRANDKTWGITPEHVAKVKAYLDKGIPVGAGLHLTKEPETVPVGKDSAGNTIWAVLTLNKDLLAANDDFGHSVAIVGYQETPESGCYFIARNNGGPDWADDGFKPIGGYFFLHTFFFERNVGDLIAFTKPIRGAATPRLPKTLFIPSTKQPLPWAAKGVMAKPGAGAIKGV